MKNDIDPAASSWHIDRRVPVALIITIIVQTVGVVWWAASLSVRVAALEGQVQRITVNSDEIQKAALRATRLEVQQAAIQASLADVKASLRRIEAKLDEQK